MQPIATDFVHDQQTVRPEQRSAKDPFAPWVSSRHPGILKGTHRVTGQVKWRVRYRPHPDARQTSKTFTTLEAARRFQSEQSERTQARRDGRRQMPIPRRTERFEDWAVDNYIGVRTNPSSVATYRRSLERIRTHDPEFLELRLGLISKVDLERLVACLVRAGYSGNTVNATVALAVGVMDSAVENGHIPPFGFKIEGQRPAPGKATPTDLELLAIIDGAPPWYRGMVACTAILGLRSGEVRGLTVEAVDGLAHSIRDGWVYTPDQFSWEARIHRQLSHDGRTLGPVKGSRHRDVYPDEAALQVIVEHLNRFGVGPKLDGGHLIFQRFSRTGEPEGPMGGSYFGNVVAHASRKGLGRTFTPHALRRLHVTLRLDAGEQVKQVSVDVGHFDTELTQRVYNDLQRRRRERGQAFSRVAERANAAAAPHEPTPVSRLSR